MGIEQAVAFFEKKAPQKNFWFCRGGAGGAAMA
jgi:hypothetical protein